MNREAISEWRLFEKYRFCFAFVLLFILVSFFRFETGHITDDAFITYRSADNLLKGYGLVFNPGEKVLATTTPFYSIVIAGFILFGMPPWYASLVLDCFLVTGMIAFLYLFSRQIGDRVWGLFTVLLLFANPYSLLPVGGMETGLFNLCVFGSLFFCRLKKKRLAVMLALLAVFTRPEGVLLLLIVVPALVWDFKNRRPAEDAFAVGSILAISILLYILILTSYYGSIIPQSVWAKRAVTHSGNPHDLFYKWFFRTQFFTFGRLNLLGFLEWIGIFLMIVHYRPLRSVALFFILYLGFMKLGRAPLFLWYLTPLYPIQIMAICLSVTFFSRKLISLSDWIFQRCKGCKTQKRPLVSQKPAVVISLCVLLLFIFGSNYLYNSLRIHFWILYNEKPIVGCKRYEAAGRWIREHSRKRDIVATPEIGYIGYFSGRYIFDPMGIASPEAVQDYGLSSVYDWAIRKDARYVVHPYQKSQYTPLPPEFVKRYGIARTYFWKNESTVVFRRHSPALLEKTLQEPDLEAGIYPEKYPDHIIRRSSLIDH